MSEHEEQHPARAWGSQTVPAHIAVRLADAEARAEAAEAKVQRIEALAWDWEFDQGDLGNDTFLIRTAAREVREALRGDQ